MATVIMRGDQYALGLIITQNGVKITPDDVTDLRVKIGNAGNIIAKSYGGGEIVYDSSEQRWLFPLTAEQTTQLSTSVGVVCQAQLVYPNTDIRGTAVTPVSVHTGLF